jgi:hypothetical protein
VDFQAQIMSQAGNELHHKDYAVFSAVHAFVTDGTPYAPGAANTAFGRIRLAIGNRVLFRRSFARRRSAINEMPGKCRASLASFGRARCGFGAGARRVL